ncbi:MAG: AraC family transcriptional regulator [Clostridia bacterium]|nr:AraC family transcriptional regulator [Clostridia bacterium]
MATLSVLPAELVKVEEYQKKYHLDKRYLAHPLSFGNCSLFQIGRLYCTDTTVIPKHAHINWFELTIVTGGKGTVLTNDVGIPVRRGDIYLSFPCDFHGIVSDPRDPLKYDFFAFSTKDPHMAADLERIEHTYLPADLRLFQDDTVSALISQALGEIDRDAPYSERLLSAMFEQVMIRVIRSFQGETNLPPRGNISQPESLCYYLMNYIDTHIYTMTGLEELSRVTNYNYSYLSALFRKITSGTLTDYYRNRRLETARLLILQHDLSITHIADLLNYSSIYTFSRAFKDKYGISPEQYRKKTDV